MFTNVRFYFEHHRSERNGALALLIILFLIIVASYAYARFYVPPKPDLSQFAATLDSLKASEEAASAAETRDDSLFNFDPNLLDDSGYLALGFTAREVATLRKYQGAGGKFKKKSDVAKLFFVDEEEYARLEAYIDLPEQTPFAKKARKKEYRNPYEKEPTEEKVKRSSKADTVSYSYTPMVCDLNYSDTTELKKLRGIGSFYAKKIVAYREELGGYHSLGQLLELYKMTPEKVDLFADKVVVDGSNLRKLRINTLTAQQLSMHPYLSFKLANAIVARREQGGAFANMKALESTGLVNAELSGKLAPYLEF